LTKYHYYRVLGKNLDSFDDLRKIPDILVVGGRSPNPTSAVEVVSFKEVVTEQKFPSFPFEIAGLIGRNYNFKAISLFTFHEIIDINKSFMKYHSQLTCSSRPKNLKL
jgi:hypothetical protein